jgi:hypothetical protein
MSITYEEALSTLQNMFGEPWNRDSLDAVLRHQKGHMENTVDMILRHGNKDPDILIDQIENGIDPIRSETAADEQLARQLARQTTPLPANAILSGSLPSANEHVHAGKGKPTTLPEDFLRPPGYTPGMTNSVSDDEALARMLQDELFTEELRRNPDFAHLAHGRASNARLLGQQSSRSNTNSSNTSLNPAAAAVNRFGEFARSLTGQHTQQQRSSNHNDNEVAQSPNILEKISELGDNAKRRLQLLAAQFNANNNGTRTSSTDPGTKRAPEFRSLLDNDDDNMELAARKDL